MPLPQVGLQASILLDDLMKRFNVQWCVIDALPDIHATRDFAMRHHGSVYLNYFVETQKGSTHWDYRKLIVQENRTEILDSSRRAIREALVDLPRRSPVIETFATHMAAIAKKLEEDENSGEQRYTYLRSGPDHFAMAFTGDVVAWKKDSYGTGVVKFDDDLGGRGPWVDLEEWIGRQHFSLY